MRKANTRMWIISGGQRRVRRSWAMMKKELEKGDRYALGAGPGGAQLRARSSLVRRMIRRKWNRESRKTRVRATKTRKTEYQKNGN